MRRAILTNLKWIIKLFIYFYFCSEFSKNTYTVRLSRPEKHHQNVSTFIERCLYFYSCLFSCIRAIHTKFLCVDLQNYYFRIGRDFFKLNNETEWNEQQQQQNGQFRNEMILRVVNISLCVCFFSISSFHCLWSGSKFISVNCKDKMKCYDKQSSPPNEQNNNSNNILDFSQMGHGWACRDTNETY